MKESESKIDNSLNYETDEHIYKKQEVNSQLDENICSDDSLQMTISYVNNFSLCFSQEDSLSNETQKKKYEEFFIFKKRLKLKINKISSLDLMNLIYNITNETWSEDEPKHKMKEEETGKEIEEKEEEREKKENIKENKKEKNMIPYLKIDKDKIEIFSDKDVMKINRNNLLNTNSSFENMVHNEDRHMGIYKEQDRIEINKEENKFFINVNHNIDENNYKNNKDDDDDGSDYSTGENFEGEKEEREREMKKEQDENHNSQDNLYNFQNNSSVYYYYHQNNNLNYDKNISYQSNKNNDNNLFLYENEDRDLKKIGEKEKFENNYLSLNLILLFFIFIGVCLLFFVCLYLFTVLKRSKQCGKIGKNSKVKNEKITSFNEKTTLSPGKNNLEKEDKVREEAQESGVTVKKINIEWFI